MKILCTVGNCEKTILDFFGLERVYKKDDLCSGDSKHCINRGGEGRLAHLQRGRGGALSTEVVHCLDGSFSFEQS